jgi:predicted secreted protein
VKNVSYNDEKIEARIGDTINISLDYPPTAGFEWELKSFDKEFCNLSDNKSHIKIDNSNMYRNIWSFVCLKSGNTVIDYTFLRGLNKGKGFGNDETKSFNIVITE